jgi:lipocalin
MGDSKVDLSRYMGTWEQISVQPLPKFQKGCKDVKAIYTLRKDGKVDVLNVCDNRTIKGVARSVSDDNRHLKVSFFPFIWADYNIVNIDAEYRNAIVKGGKYTWKLQKMMTYDEYETINKQKGRDRYYIKIYGVPEDEARRRNLVVGSGGYWAHLSPREKKEHIEDFKKKMKHWH